MRSLSVSPQMGFSAASAAAASAPNDWKKVANAFVGGGPGLAARIFC